MACIFHYDKVQGSDEGNKVLFFFRIFFHKNEARGLFIFMDSDIFHRNNSIWASLHDINVCIEHNPNDKWTLTSYLFIDFFGESIALYNASEEK